MGTADGSVLGMQPINVNGPRDQRFNLVVMSDGYQAGDMAQFVADAQHLVGFFEATPPFDDPLLRSKFNYFRVNVASTDRGADKPAPCFDAPITARTYFDASYCTSGIQRTLAVDNTIAASVAGTQVPEYTKALVLVNDPEPGGSGSPVGVSAARAPDWEQRTMHELGHSLFGLADEYCESVDHERYTGIEPAAVNVTIDSNRDTIEWREFIDAATLVPTMSNPDCTTCDDARPSPVPAGTVGAFEGARFFHCGLYRPQHDCTMRFYNTPFCAVCADAIRQTLRPYSGVPRRVEVAAPDIHFLFHPPPSIGLQDFSGSLAPIGATGAGFVQSRLLPRAPAGVAASGLFGYEYRVHLIGVAGGGANACITDLTLEVGPVIPLNYDGSGLSNIFVITQGALGTVRPAFAVQLRDRLTLFFDPPICPGESSVFIGFASRYPPRDEIAELHDAHGNFYAIPAKVPDIPPMPGPVLRFP
jgi:hypothetical protein